MLCVFSSMYSVVYFFTTEYIKILHREHRGCSVVGAKNYGRKMLILEHNLCSLTPGVCPLHSIMLCWLWDTPPGVRKLNLPSGKLPNGKLLRGKPPYISLSPDLCEIKFSLPVRRGLLLRITMGYSIVTNFSWVSAIKTFLILSTSSKIVS